MAHKLPPTVVTNLQSAMPINYNLPQRFVTEQCPMAHKLPPTVVTNLQSAMPTNYNFPLQSAENLVC
jgi:hypothetical protein